MIRFPKSDPIDYLVHRKHPQYRYAVAPIITSGTGGMSYETRQKIVGEAEAYLADLQSKPRTEVVTLYAAEKAKEYAEAQAKAELEEQQRFFNLPSAGADFAHWSKAAHWTLDEAIALCFGKAPDVVNWKNVSPYTKISPFAATYESVRDLALRATVWKQLYDPVLPGIFLAWARRCEIEVPPELVAQVEKRGIVIADWKDLYDEVKGQHDEILTMANREISKASEALAKGHEERETLLRENADLKVQAAENEAARWEGFNQDSSNYPSELDIAMQAWRGVTKGQNTGGTAKERIERWLDVRYPDRRDLSNEARQRIAVICNWEKSGGRPRRKEK